MEVQSTVKQHKSGRIMYCINIFLDHQIPNCVGESNQKKEDSMEHQYKSIESKVIPTTIQGSASAPLLPTGKLSETVHVRETSSWDTPSKVTEPIKSLAALEDVRYGIGDQSPTKENQMGMYTLFGTSLLNEPCHAKLQG